MTTIAAHPDTRTTTALDAVAASRHRGSATAGVDLVFSEVRQARRLRGLQAAAVTTGLFSVTAAASAAIVLGLSA